MTKDELLDELQTVLSWQDRIWVHQPDMAYILNKNIVRISETCLDHAKSGFALLSEQVSDKMSIIYDVIKDNINEIQDESIVNIVDQEMQAWIDKFIVRIREASLASPGVSFRDIQEVNLEAAAFSKEVRKLLAIEKKRLLNMSPKPNVSRKIFLGHGRSHMWMILRDLLERELGLQCDEFNSVSAAGTDITSRLNTMLNDASFAFIIMTAEDQQVDGTTRARENVVHEAGLFQGRLGFDKAIIMLEDGCEQFSNINGLVYIAFHKGDIKSAFEDVRKVLKREGF